MPIIKYHSFDEASKSLWCLHPTLDYYKSVFGLYELFYRLFLPSYPSGIFKYKDLESANKQKFEWDISRAMQRKTKRSRESSKS